MLEKCNTQFEIKIYQGAGRKLVPSSIATSNILPDMHKHISLIQELQLVESLLYSLTLELFPPSTLRLLWDQKYFTSHYDLSFSYRLPRYLLQSRDLTISRTNLTQAVSFTNEFHSQGKYKGFWYPTLVESNVISPNARKFVRHISIDPPFREKNWLHCKKSPFFESVGLKMFSAIYLYLSFCPLHCTFSKLRIHFIHLH